MPASPALWTARAIIASAIGVGIGYIAIGPASRPAPATPPKPLPRRLIVKQTVKPAPKPSPTPEPYAIKRILDTGGPIPYGRWFWNEAGVPQGKVIITVDLQASVLSIFRAGYEIGTAAIIYGADEKPTPLGVFPILGKDAKHVSNLYNAPMPYTLRLTGDGVSIHGSGHMTYQAATHGCIGIPTPFARKLFAATKIGDKVIITRGEHLSEGAPVKAL